MANTASGAALACFVFASDDLFYNISVNVRNAVLTRTSLAELASLGRKCNFQSTRISTRWLWFRWNVP